MLHHGRPGRDYDPSFWRALHGLQDRIWPGMSTRADAARRLGIHWEAETTPFAWVEDGRALAHVGVLAHPVRLGGEDRVVAGIHAVCVDPEVRGRGLGRRCMEAALAFIDERFDASKLSTDIPDYYRRWGFEVVPRHRFIAGHRGAGGGPARPATWGDAERIGALFAARAPISDLWATREPGWLPITVLALLDRLPAGILMIPDGDFLLVARSEGETVHIDDIVGPELPGLERVLAALPCRFERIVYGFTPDRLDPTAVAEPLPIEEGVLQVRGAWPSLPPFAVSPVWEH